MKYLPSIAALAWLLIAQGAELSSFFPPKDGRVLLPAGIHASGDFSIPADVTVVFSSGAVLEVRKGAALRIDGLIEAGAERIFSGDGSVTGRPRNSFILPEWFGAKADGKTDCGEAFRKSGDLARFCAGRRLHIGKGRYLWSGIVTWRCNVDCLGTLVKMVDPVPRKHYYNTYQPHWVARKATRIVFESDGRKYRLDPALFTGIRRGDTRIARTAEIPILNPGGGSVTLKPGGTLLFQSSDYFTSRANGKGDEFYTPTDLVRIKAATGEIEPAFAFSYPDRRNAPSWNASRKYAKGDVVQIGGNCYKATFESGPGTVFHDRFRGNVSIGSRSPADGEFHYFKFADGRSDRIRLWLKLTSSVTYVEPQRPFRIRGLQIEILSASSESDVKPLYDTTVFCYRSNMTFENCRFLCSDNRILPSVLMAVAHTAGNTWKNCVFSGARYHSLGYNLSIYNTIGTRLLNCRSDNCRDGVSGRHNKNVLVDGGLYNRLDDHYGENFTIRNVEINALSTWVPGFRTPECNVQKWEFRPTWAIAYAGSGLTLENCRIRNARGIICNRADVGDFGGAVIVRDLAVESDGPVELIRYESAPDFDYTHPILRPETFLVERTRLTGKGGFVLNMKGNTSLPFVLRLRESGPFSAITATGVNLDFLSCAFRSTHFQLDHAAVSFRNSSVTGTCSGADPE